MILEIAHQVHGMVGTVLLAPPDPGDGIAPPGSEKIITLLSWAKWLVTAAAVAGGLVIGGKMFLAHRRGDDANMGQLGIWLAGCILIGVTPQIVGLLS